MKMMGSANMTEHDPHWRTACPKFCSGRVRFTYQNSGIRYREDFSARVSDCVAKCPYEEHFHCMCDQCGHEWTTEGPFKEIKDDGEEDSKS